MSADPQIVIDPGSPPRVDGASVSSTVTTAAFNAPAGSLIVACVVANSGSGVSTTAAMSNSGAPLTWAANVEANFASTGRSGYSAIFTAPVPTARTGMTVTVTTGGSGSTLRRPSLKVYVLTHSTGGTLAASSGLATWTTANAWTISQPVRAGAYPLVVLSTSEWKKLGVPTSLTFPGGGFDQAGSDGVSGVIGAAQMGVSGRYQRYDVDAFGNSTAEWNIASLFIFASSAETPAGFIPIPESTTDTPVQIQAAFGADLSDTSGRTWDWSDITSHIRQDPGLAIRVGRGDEASTSQPASLTCTLDNTTGAYSVAPGGPNYPYVRQGVPVRVRAFVEGSTSPTVLFQGYAAAWEPGWEVPGSPRITKLTAAGYLRRALQGASPLESALRRSFSGNPYTVGYWPCEDGGDATSLAPAVGLTAGAFSVGADPAGKTTDAPSSGPVVKLGGGALSFNVDPFPAVLVQMVRCLFQFPKAGTIADGTLLMQVFCTGTAAKFDLNYKTGGNVQLNVRDRFENIIYASPTLNWGLDGECRLMDLTLTQNGADIDWTWGTLRPGAAVLGASIGTVAAYTIGTIRGVTVNATGLLDDVGFGHLAILANDVRRSSLQRALNGWAGELSQSGRSTGADEIPRLQRLAQETGLLVQWQEPSPVGGGSQPFAANTDFTPADYMGVQGGKTVVDLAREVEATDGGILYDGVGPGLTYVERRVIESAGAAYLIDAAARTLAPSLAPVADDQRLRNSVTVARANGSEATAVDVTGPMGTAAVGLYEDSTTLSLFTDEGCLLEAGWRLSKGTVPGYRFPTLELDLKALPNTINPVAFLRPGHLVRVDNLNAVLPFGPQSIVRLLVEGVQHRITARGWRVTLVCSPYQTWRVGVAAADTGTTDGYVLRGADDGTSTLAAGAAAGATSISVATPAGSPLWTRVADDFVPNLLLDVGGHLVTCSAISGASSPQTFTVSALPAAVAAGAKVTLADVGQTVPGL